MFTLRKNGRVCYPFPLQSAQVEQIPDGYQRVFIPFTQTEKMNSKKTGHIQVIHNRNLIPVKEHRLKIHA
jgi:hypothetical protein